MDIKKCRGCGDEFDFDVRGLACNRDDGPFYVCCRVCAVKAAKDAGHYHAIHDKADVIVNTNAPPDHPDLKE